MFDLERCSCRFRAPAAVPDGIAAAKMRDLARGIPLAVWFHVQGQDKLNVGSRRRLVGFRSKMHMAGTHSITRAWIYGFAWMVLTGLPSVAVRAENYYPDHPVVRTLVERGIGFLSKTTV